MKTLSKSMIAQYCTFFTFLRATLIKQYYKDLGDLIVLEEAAKREEMEKI